MTTCPICQSKGWNFIFQKDGYDYLQCVECESILVPNGIDQSMMEVGGDKEIERNETQNAERIKRFIDLVGNDAKILDFGCGTGYLMADCNDEGLFCAGYDKYNEVFNRIVDTEYDLVSMVEIIEHTFKPFSELNKVYSVLKTGGYVYIETSFVDIMDKPYESVDYINPKLGHCTIFSHKGLDILMGKKGFIPMEHINDNVRIFKKK